MFRVEIGAIVLISRNCIVARLVGAIVGRLNCDIPGAISDAILITIVGLG
jgi:hypothetical protein